MSDLRTFEQIEPGDVNLVGGKGLSLALLTQAGLPVPPGFCITTRAFGKSLADSAELRAEILAAYHQLGSGTVAVRSSAIAEDGAETSFAGQQETVLGVSSDAELLAAVTQCWASLETERAAAYRRHQAVDDIERAMAVIVQRLIEAEAAGVLFTRDPLDPDGRWMLVESSWGLGESVVSGRVTPDRFHIDHETGQLRRQKLGTKQILCRLRPRGAIAGGPSTEYVEVPETHREIPSLTAGQLSELAALGRRVEVFAGAPRDVEWAYAQGRCWLLQARPITAVTAAEREQVRQQEIATLATRAEPGGTVWSRYNLAEILPTPTPMTWAIVRRFMSGRGGFGLMHRDLGFDPDPALDDEGIFDLVCGRPYCNLSRQLRMQFRQPPLEYPLAALRASPAKALYPQPVANPARAGVRFWFLLPWVSLRLAFRIARLHSTLPAELRQVTFPRFAAEATAETAVDLTLMDSAALLERLEHWILKTLHDFARASLKPTALAGMVLEGLERRLLSLLGPEQAREAMGHLVGGVHPDPEADLPAAVRELAEGTLEQAAFLQRFGHRGSQEMELARPRWAEETAPALPTPARGPGTPTAVAAAGNANRLLTEAQWQTVRPEVEKLHTLLALRETGKHYLMMGYALLRRILLELDRRHALRGGIFYLTPEELPRLIAGEDLRALIGARKRRRQVVMSLEVPPVLFSDDLQAIGRPEMLAGANAFQGVPLSAGVAEGPALVLEEPRLELAPADPFILVCPSTDPAWVPLFVRASGLVMETGGVLSHGAIVAREFGLPAVAGILGVTQRLSTGQRVRVEGTTGRVVLLG